MGAYNNVKPFYPTETPMLKGSNNIAFVKKYPIWRRGKPMPRVHIRTIKRMCLY